jgi:hypothetical protein
LKSTLMAARNPSACTNGTGPARLQTKTQERTKRKIVSLPRRRRFGRHPNCRLRRAAGDGRQTLASSKTTKTGPAAVVRASTEMKSAHGGVLANPSASGGARETRFWRRKSETWPAALFREQNSGAATLARSARMEPGRALTREWKANSQMDSREKIKARLQEPEQKSTPKIKSSEPKQRD